MNLNLIAGVAAVGVAWMAYTTIGQQAVVAERARVTEKANKTDAKAQKARAAAVAQPDSVLAKFCRDCGKSGSVQVLDGGVGLKK